MGCKTRLSFSESPTLFLGDSMDIEIDIYLKKSEDIEILFTTLKKEIEHKVESITSQL